MKRSASSFLSYTFFSSRTNRLISNQSSAANFLSFSHIIRGNKQFLSDQIVFILLLSQEKAINSIRLGVLEVAFSGTSI